LNDIKQSSKEFDEFSIVEEDEKERDKLTREMNIDKAILCNEYKRDIQEIHEYEILEEEEEKSDQNKVVKDKIDINDVTNMNSGKTHHRQTNIINKSIGLNQLKSYEHILRPAFLYICFIFIYFLLAIPPYLNDLKVRQDHSTFREGGKLYRCRDKIRDFIVEVDDLAFLRKYMDSGQDAHCELWSTHQVEEIKDWKRAMISIIERLEDENSALNIKIGELDEELSKSKQDASYWKKMYLENDPKTKLGEMREEISKYKEAISVLRERMIGTNNKRMNDETMRQYDSFRNIWKENLNITKMILDFSTHSKKMLDRISQAIKNLPKTTDKLMAKLHKFSAKVFHAYLYTYNYTLM